MTSDTNGNLYIATYGGHKIIKVDPRLVEFFRKMKSENNFNKNLTFSEGMALF